MAASSIHDRVPQEQGAGTLEGWRALAGRAHVNGATMRLRLRLRSLAQGSHYAWH